ncbi:MAG: LysM peptidoglycan-binding domain-containing protein [Anaerolineae bacterium]|nr:LysM peptidoglycan-binding domain-containing protein [Anaerolineae bacterium]
MRRYLFLSLIVFLLASLLALPFGAAKAQSSVSGADMINLMNQWRSGYWSNPLVEDAALNQCAQWTADEMARMGAKGHLTAFGYTAASVRCAEFGFGGGNKVFVTENWAGGQTLTIDILAGYWADYWHMLPATEQQYRYVGVGKSTDSAGYTYYILQAGAISGDTGSGSSVGSGTVPTALPVGSTPVVNNYVISFPTSTPDLDGNISHVVKSGESLYTIAVNYGVTIDAIKTLNAMTTNNIYVGNILKISLKPTPTITPTRTSTVMMPTRTSTQTLMPTTPGPTRTSTPTPAPTQLPLLERIDRQYLGLTLLVLSAAGFFVVIFFFFIRPKFKKQ